MFCLLPQFRCQPDTFAVNFGAHLTKIRVPVHFQALCVLSTISAPTSTAIVLDAEKLHSLEAHSNSFSATSPWTHIEPISPPTEANLEATLVREALITSDEAVVNAAAAEAIALAKAAVKVAKDAKTLMVNNYQYMNAESRPIIPSEVNSTQSSWVQLIETEEFSGIGAQTGLVEDRSFQRQTEESDLEPMDEELKFLEEQLSNTVAVKSTRQTERKARRERASTKAAANVVSEKLGTTRRKTRSSGVRNHGDPLRLIKLTTKESKLLTAAEERVLSAGIQDLLKLERLQNELAERCGGEPTFTQWAAAAGLEHRTLQSRLNYGINCKGKMVKCNVRLVVSIARNYMRSGMDLQDLVQEGCRGLIKATEKFDASKGFKFSTYAHWWIKQAIQKGVNKKSNFVSVPAHIVEASYKVKRARAKFVDENSRQPSNEELAAAAGVTMKKLTSVQLIPKVISLDQKTNGNYAKPSDFVSNPDQESLEQMAMKEFLKKDIDNILDSLRPQESQVIRWRFGMVDGRSRALQEVGELMSVSRERIRQIELTALRKLKNKKEVKDLENYHYHYAEDSNY